MAITVNEFKDNVDRYLAMAQTEDLFITLDGKVIAKLSNPDSDKVAIAKSLFGLLPQDMTLEESRNAKVDEI